MKTEHIKYFLEVVKQGSINKASENLCINHQHLGKIITALEDEIGGKLLERNRVGICCNTFGHQAVALMKQINSLYDELTNLFDDHQGHSTIQTLSCMVFARSNHANQNSSVLRLQKRFPNISISFVEASNADILSAVSERIDCIGNIFQFVHLPVPRIDLPENCMVYSCMDMEPVVILNKKNPLLLKYKTISAKTLQQYPLVFYSPYSFELHHFNQMLSAFGQLNPKYIVSNLQSYTEILLKTDAISLGFKPLNHYHGKLLLSDELEALTYIPIRENILAQSQWIINKNAIHDQLICDYIDYAISYEY